MKARHATIDDVLAICALEAELFPDNCFNEVTLSNELVQGKGWVLYIDNALAGYLMMQYDGALYDIIRLGVIRTHWGQGLGTALLQHALVEKQGPVILTVQEDNLRAMRLYKRHGFKIVGQLEGGWVMRHD